MVLANVDKSCVFREKAIPWVDGICTVACGCSKNVGNVQVRFLTRGRTNTNGFVRKLLKKKKKKMVRTKPSIRK